MPRLIKRDEQEADPLAQLHADPTERPGVLDGLIVDGHDTFAELRRRARERQMGRPDPTPRVVAPTIHRRRHTTNDIPPTTRTPKEKTPMVAQLNQAPLAHVDTPTARTPATQPVRAFEVISAATFAALIGQTRPGRYDYLDEVCSALDRGECIRLPIPDPKKLPATRSALRKRAILRGFKVEIKSGSDWIAAQKVGAA